MLIFLTCRSGSVYAVVELAFGSTAIDPLKPLRDEMNDGKLGSFTVVYPIFAGNQTNVGTKCEYIITDI